MAVKGSGGEASGPAGRPDAGERIQKLAPCESAALPRLLPSSNNSNLRPYARRAAPFGVVGRKLEDVEAIEVEHHGRGVGADAVVGNQHQRRLQVDHVAGDMERIDLPPAVGQRLVAANDPFGHQAAGKAALAFAHDVAVQRDRMTLVGQGQERLPRFVGQGMAPLDLAKEKLHAGIGIGQTRLPPGGAHACLSAAGSRGNVRRWRNNTLLRVKL